MKAILVIDEMPTGCIGCPCYYEDRGKCQNTWEEIEDDCTRPSWCPLRPLPSKRHIPITKTFGTPFNVGKAKGWNACLDAITGETNG